MDTIWELNESALIHQPEPLCDTTVTSSVELTTLQNVDGLITDLDVNSITYDPTLQIPDFRIYILSGVKPQRTNSSIRFVPVTTLILIRGYFLPAQSRIQSFIHTLLTTTRYQSRRLGHGTASSTTGYPYARHRRNRKYVLCPSAHIPRAYTICHLPSLLRRFYSLFYWC